MMFKSFTYFIITLVLGTVGLEVDEHGNGANVDTYGYHPATIVAIAPYDDVDSSLTNFVAKEIESFYPVKTVILPVTDMPEYCKADNSDKYQADVILKYLKTIKPQRVNYVLAITSVDFETNHGHLPQRGLIGLGNRPGTTSVVSTSKLHRKLSNSRYGDKKFRDRLIKACFHEIGHNLGLKHCNKNSKCLMRDGNGTMRTLDEMDKYLCNYCRRHLRKNEIFEVNLH